MGDSGHFDPVAADPEEGGGGLHARPSAPASKFEVLRQASLKAASSFREGTSKAAANASRAVREKDWTREQGALGRVRQGVIGATQTVAKGGAAVIQRTSEGARKIFGGPLQAVAKGEHNTRPCPRLVLVCCASIASGGLAEPHLFKEHVVQHDGEPGAVLVNADEVYVLFGTFENAHGIVLPPTGTSAHVLAATVKKFLLTLPEPLLTFKALPEFMAAAGDPHAALELLPRLPPVNFNTLHVLLETLSRVAEFSEHNLMTPAALAEEIAPCVGWHPVPKQRGGGGWPWAGPADGEELQEEDGYLVSPRLDLSPQEVQALSAVLAWLIANFRTWNEGVVFT